MTTEPNGTALATRDQASIIEQVVAKGDLGQLSPQERVTYYREVCRSLGLNELTQPFGYIVLNGKVTLYPRKDCTDQLRKVNHVNITKIEREQIGDLYVVTAYAQSGDRTDSDIGAVSITGLRGEALANAMMKSITKAKRRVTLSICGLGWTDESEVESIPGAQTLVVDSTTGEVLEERPRQPNTTDLVTSADDRVWKRWEQIRKQALDLGLRVEELRLPLPRAQFVTAGVQLSAAIAGRKAQLAQEDAERAAGETARSESGPPPLPDSESLGRAGTDASPAPESARRPTRAELWARNRELCNKAVELGVAGRDDMLNNRSTDDVIAQTNADLEARIEKAESSLVQGAAF